MFLEAGFGVGGTGSTVGKTFVGRSSRSLWSKAMGGPKYLGPTTGTRTIIWGRAGTMAELWGELCAELFLM